MLSLTIGLQILHLIYNQVCTLCDLFPFNGVRSYTPKERLTEAAWNGAIMVMPVIGYVSGVTLLMEVGLLCLLVLLCGEVATWWIPYFFGASPKWVEIYTRVHSRTVTPLPPRGVNPVPNWEHLILMGITLSTTLFSFFTYRSIHGYLFPYWWILVPVAAVLVFGVVMQCCVTPRVPSKAGDTPP